MHSSILIAQRLERQYHQLSLQHCTASEIIQNVAQNQAWSTRIYRIWIDQLARALSDAIIHFKPKLLILSGGLIQHPDLALTLRSALSRYCLSEALPKIECLNNEGYDFAKGSVSMYTVNCAQLPTFTSWWVVTLTGKFVWIITEEPRDRAGNKLMDFGFTKTDALVYINLLKNGRASGYKIAKDISLSRSSVYSSIDNLYKNGCIFMSDGETKEYEAKSPDLIFSQIEKKP